MTTKNSYSNFFQKKSRRINLESIGFPDLWFEITLASSLTPKQLRTLSNLDTAPLESGQGAFSKSDTEMITAWNLPSEDGSILKTPKEDESVLDLLPFDVIWVIREALDQSYTEVVPPKLRGMRSTTTTE